eukprot:jgi/Botrbrau1/21959/Bobra.0249s0082.1
MDKAPLSFQVHLKPDDIKDLQMRLEHARWPDELEDEQWQYGTDKTYLKELAEYWRTGFSFKNLEDTLNQYKQYTLSVNGIHVHFLHERSANPDAIPLLFLHGWPGSFFEVYKILPLLQAGKERGAPDFHVVAPSLPGFGFSSAPTKKGFGTVKMAETVNGLMLKLGYPKYVAQGGDAGAFIGKALGAYHSENCRAFHTNMPIALPNFLNPWDVAIFLNAVLPGVKNFPLLLSRKELQGARDYERWEAKETGYSKIQGTKPQTLGYAMTDSPVGLLAWIVEKFRSWSDCNGNVESVFSKDELLTNVSIYWFSGSITSSFRVYYEESHLNLMKSSSSGGPPKNSMTAYCKVPTGVALLPKELFTPIWRFMRSSYNLKQVSEFDRGGHFAAMEVPDLLARDIQDFFRKWH